jgi:hypothetical protein
MMPAGHRKEAVEISGIPLQMHDQEGLRPRCDAMFDVGGIQVERFVDLRENGERTCQ